METRVCEKCGLKKVLKEAFRKSYLSKSGIQNYRRKCKLCYAKERKEKNRDPEVKKKIKQKYDIWAAKNKERIAKLKSEYHKKNKEQINKKHKEWINKNKDRVSKTSQVWKEKNKEKWLSYRADYERNRRKNDPLFALIGNIRGGINKAFKNHGYTKKSKTSQILGANFEVVKIHIESQFIDGMSWDNRDEWEIDHIVPLASANNEDELYALAHYKNLQPLWDDLNLAKSDKFDPKEKEEYLKWYYENVAK